MIEQVKKELLMDIEYSIISGLILYITVITIGLLYCIVNPIWIVLIQVVCCVQLVFFIGKKYSNIIHSVIRFVMTFLVLIMLTAICAPLYRVLSESILPKQTVMQENFGGMLSLFSLALNLVTGIVTLLVLVISKTVSHKKNGT